MYIPARIIHILLCMESSSSLPTTTFPKVVFMTLGYFKINQRLVVLDNYVLLSSV